MLDQDAEKQKELFEEFQKPARKPFFFKSNNKYLQNNMFIWQISSEKIVFLSIGIILLAVITFCLGVERGKHLREASIPASPSSTGQVPTRQQISEEPVPTDTRSSVKEPASTAPQKKYTIMVASYVKKDDAQKDAVRLKKAGFPVYVAQSGKFFVIKVGDFNDKAQADATVSALKKNYGYTDIYIRTNK